MDTIFVAEKQEFLVDKHPTTGKKIPWSKYKTNNLKLVESFRRLEKIDPMLKGRAPQLQECGSWLEFRRYESGDLALNRANFCKYRLCPICGFRRSLKNYGQASQVMNVAETNQYRFLFVTLTVRNCPGSALGKIIDLLFQGHTRLLRQGRYKSQIKGWMRTLEVTHNVDRKSSSFDTYHPHLHMIWAVKSGYFKGKNYIGQSDLIQDWASAAQLDYMPNVDIRAIPVNKTIGAIKEVSKYCTKASDILTDDNELTDSGVWYLDRALAGRRLISYGGILKTIKADLNLDDAETGDLVNVDGDQLRDDLAYVIEVYHWNTGYNQYLKQGV
jgi:plasmid rolling circle replication initiator protein Rep